MFNFLFLSVLISTSSFASTLILEKHAQSGFVLPENTFSKECKIYSEGRMESLSINGDGTAIGFSRDVSTIHINTIKILNRLAQRGEIKIAPVVCDGGSVVVKGHIGSIEVEIQSSKDCVENRLNLSTAARLLRSMAREVCGF